MESSGIRDSAVVSPSRMIAQTDGYPPRMYNGLTPSPGGPSFGKRSLKLHVRPTFLAGLRVAPWWHAITVARRYSG